MEISVSYSINNFIAMQNKKLFLRISFCMTGCMQKVVIQFFFAELKILLYTLLKEKIFHWKNSCSHNSNGPPTIIGFGLKVEKGQLLVKFSKNSMYGLMKSLHVLIFSDSLMQVAVIAYCNMTSLDTTLHLT